MIYRLKGTAINRPVMIVRCREEEAVYSLIFRSWSFNEPKPLEHKPPNCFSVFKIPPPLLAGMARVGWSWVFLLPRWVRFWKYSIALCWEPAWGTPPMAKVMRKEASAYAKAGSSLRKPLFLSIYPQNQSPTLLFYALTYTSDFMGALPHHLSQRRS